MLNYPNKQLYELCDILGKSKRRILNKSVKMGLRKDSNYKRVGNVWSDKDIFLLKENFNKKETSEIAIMLCKGYDEVRWMVKKMNLYKDDVYISKISADRNRARSGYKYTIDKLKEISSKYYTRGQFCENDAVAYTTSLRMGVLDDICSHMYVGKYSTPQLILRYILESVFGELCEYNDRKIIKPYELDVYFTSIKIAFEFDGKYWHRNGDNSNIKKGMCEELGIMVFFIKEISNNYEYDIKKQLTCILGIDVCDVYVDYDVIYKNIYHVEKMKEEISKYDNIYDLRKMNSKLFYKLHRMKIFDKLTGELSKNRVNWCDDLAMESIITCSDIKEFKIKYGKTCYRWIKRKNKEYLLEYYNKT